MAIRIPKGFFQGSWYNAIVITFPAPSSCKVSSKSLEPLQSCHKYIPTNYLKRGYLYLSFKFFRRLKNLLEYHLSAPSQLTEFHCDRWTRSYFFCHLKIGYWDCSMWWFLWRCTCVTRQLPCLWYLHITMALCKFTIRNYRIQKHILTTEITPTTGITTFFSSS